MPAGCESMQRGDEEGVIEKVNGFVPKGKHRKVFGDGRASEKIAEIIHRGK